MRMYNIPQPTYVSDKQVNGKWDPYQTLNIINPDRACLTCVGYAPSANRRCRNPINSANRDLADKIIHKIAQADLSGHQLGQELRRLASTTLCLRYHQDQADKVAAEWHGKINLARSMSCQSGFSEASSKEREISQFLRETQTYIEDLAYRMKKQHERERKERERKEKERKDRKRQEIERQEREQQEIERQEREQQEREQQEREQQERERNERERQEKERQRHEDERVARQEKEREHRECEARNEKLRQEAQEAQEQERLIKEQVTRQKQKKEWDMAWESHINRWRNHGKDTIPCTTKSSKQTDAMASIMKNLFQSGLTPANLVVRMIEKNSKESKMMSGDECCWVLLGFIVPVLYLLVLSLVVDIMLYVGFWVPSLPSRALALF